MVSGKVDSVKLIFSATPLYRKEASGGWQLSVDKTNMNGALCRASQRDDQLFSTEKDVEIFLCSILRIAPCTVKMRPIANNGFHSRAAAAFPLF